MVKRWLEAQTGKNRFFVFAHYWDIHGDYSPPPPYDTLFDRDYTGEFDGSKISEIKPGMSHEDLTYMISLYDGEIRYVDDYVKKLLDRLQKLRLMDKTMVIITADHGEEFLEHGGNWHGGTLYDELIRVPLIVYMPEMEKGKVIERQVSTLDIMPTILEFLKIPLEQKIEGVSLFVSINGGTREENVFSHTGTDWLGLSAIRTEGFKYIFSGKDNRYQLYNLGEDPGEHNNLTGYGMLQETQLKSSLMGWKEDCEKILASQLKDNAEGDDSEETADPSLKERLKSLGYLH